MRVNLKSWLPLVSPLSLTAYITWMAVGYALWREMPAAHVDIASSRVTAALLMLVFLAAFICRGIEARGRVRRVPTAAAVSVLVAASFALLSLGPHSTTPVLLIIVAEELTASYRPRTAWLLLAIVNAVFLSLLVFGWKESDALFTLAIYAGFQCFAAVTTGALKRAQAAAADLKLLNAELLSTRSLLSESARDGERLRVSRELHDVAGHKLTALALNLEVLRQNSGSAGRRELELAGRLSTELLADVRNVVSSRRRDDGLDVSDAIASLANVFPRPAVHLELEPIRIVGADRAEALVRIAQEALTNAARHADADNVWVSLRQNRGDSELAIADDGHFVGPHQLGNGLTGMNERLAALGGILDTGRGPRGGFRVVARLPQERAT